MLLYPRLIHSVIINPFVWFLLRVLTGVSMVCIYTVAESWLNDRSSNKNRGSVLSIYMVILYGTMGIGMFLLNFSSPTNFQPFILVSVITSAALIPILLTLLLFGTLIVLSSGTAIAPFIYTLF